MDLQDEINRRAEILVEDNHRILPKNRDLAHTLIITAMSIGASIVYEREAARMREDSTPLIPELSTPRA